MFWNTERIDGLVGLVVLVFSIIIDTRLGGDGIVKPESWRKAYIYMPAVLIGIWNLAGYSAVSFIKWSYQNTNLYILLILILVASELVGGAIDSVIVLYKFYRRKGFIKISSDQRHKIIKYGDDRQIIRGVGRFDTNHMLYGVFSNLLGALCPLTMLLFIKTLPNFLAFLEETVWIDFFGICGPIMVIPGIQQAAVRLQKSIPDSVDSADVNPDNFLFNRLHTFCCSVSLWFTLTMVIVFGLVYFVYGIYNFREYSVNIIFILPFVALTAFLLHQALSSAAYKYNAINAKSYRIGRIIIVILAITPVILFQFSYEIIGILVFCVILFYFWGRMIRFIINKLGENEALKQSTNWIFSLLIILIVVEFSVIVIQAIRVA